MFADYRAIAFHLIFVFLSTFQIIAIAIADHASLVQYVSGKRGGFWQSLVSHSPRSLPIFVCNNRISYPVYV
ncbi:hypothetical protein [Coleofasciculus sp. E2-BRE-01]|uniref:hypothetical protein n=1 Tax=Coleofasciculus sp. E2-BRE-01 TaxID=3069524 RepID=UPI0032F9B89E